MIDIIIAIALLLGKFEDGNPQAAGGNPIPPRTAGFSAQ
jgi:hypothetical protein